MIPEKFGSKQQELVTAETPPAQNLPLLFSLSACLVVFCIFSFSKVLGFDFLNWDDDVYILKNPVVCSGLSLAGIKWAFTSVHLANWHPLTSIAYMIQVDFFGLRPMGFHATNLFFHMLNSILLFLILNRATKTIIPGFFVACLFAVHPMHVESVAWIAELKDQLSTVFAFWAIFLYVKYRTASKFSIFGVYILSLLSKTMYVTLPILFLLLDYWPLQRFRREKASNLFKEKAPYLIAAFIITKLAFWAQKAGGALQTFEGFPLTLRLENAVVAYVKYVLKMFVPINLSNFYPYEANIPFSVFFLSLICLIAVTVFCFMRRSKRPYLFMGWLFFIITLLPVIGIVQIGTQAMANRYTYVSYVGLFVMIFYFFYDISKNNEIAKKIFIISGISISIAAAFMSRAEVSYWRNTRSIFQRAVDVNPKNYMAQYQLANALYNVDGKREEAKVHVLESLVIQPNYAEAYNLLGVILLDEKKYAEAEAAFKSALVYRKDYADVFNNLAGLYFETQRDDLVLKYLRYAVMAKPEFKEAYSGILNYSMKKCDFQTIAEFLPKILSMKNIDPNFKATVEDFEKLKGQTLKEKEQACKERKEDQEIFAMADLVQTIKASSEAQKNKPFPNIPKPFKI